MAGRTGSPGVEPLVADAVRSDARLALEGSTLQLLHGGRPYDLCGLL